MPIAHGGEELGVLECGPKSRGVYSDRDYQLVVTLATQAALAVSNARLAARIVQAQEAERRRTERNIHDGAQQQLAALVAQLGRARERLRRQEKLPEIVLGDLQQAALGILGELRELALGIHPSVLADGGLLEAIEDRSSRMPIAVDIDVDPAVRGRFADEIEGAAYFFVMEALANVLKHANATSARVGLGWRNGRLVIEVADDGIGFTRSSQLGGLGGLADRLAALGGSLAIDTRPGRGTNLVAELPARPPELNPWLSGYEW